MPGAFKRWIGNFRSAKDSYVPLIDSHDGWSIFNVFGHLDDADERLTGKTLKHELDNGKTLEVKEMFLDTDWQVIDGPDGDRVLDRLRPGSIRKMSMGYEAKNWDNLTLADGGLVRRLKEVAISEGSLVVFPMNPAAEVDLSTVKGFLEDLDGETLDDNDRATLTALQKEIGALLTNGRATAEPAPEMLKTLQDRIQRLNLHRLATRIEAARHSGSRTLGLTD
jgi:HK97 family phage prohead protease